MANKEVLEATIRLFKAVPVSDSANKTQGTSGHYLMRETLNKGYVFAPEVYNQYINANDGIGEIVERLYGRDARDLNQAFHKSFATVRDSDIQDLVMMQILHYLTTYGFKSVGIFNHDTVYIPHEELDLDGVSEDLPIMVIRGLNNADLRDELLSLLGSGIALGEDTVKAAIEVWKFLELDGHHLGRVKNREVRAALYDLLGLVPDDAVEFLRFAVYKTTGKHLLIKNKETVQKIKEGLAFKPETFYLFKTYESINGLQPLAEIFYRYKPIFLAFRHGSGADRRAINRVRKLAEKHHKPMKEDYLNTVTARLSRREDLNGLDFLNALDKASVWRKARLAYALRFRSHEDVDGIVHRIRNGKSFAREFSFDNQDAARDWMGVVLSHIVYNDLQHLRGKKIHIPEGLVYGLPSTEKQFTGNIPSGSYVSVDNDIVVGVHWKNVRNYGTDLDLSLLSTDSGKIGWDGAYRSRGIQFSGDMTDAPHPKGAAEYFRVQPGINDTWLLHLNYFNYVADQPVPTKIEVADSPAQDIEKGRVLDPSNLVAFSDTVLDVKQKTLGLLVSDEHGVRFYFAEFNLGSGITARRDRQAELSRNYLVNYYTDPISLNELLVQAGAILVSKPDEADINLSPEVVDKNTFIELLVAPEVE